MSRYCPFPDQAHVPPGPHVVGSRLALRRHMVLIHQADLQVCYDASRCQYDQVVRLSGDDLARKTDVFRRAQRHRVKVTGAPSVRGCTTFGLPASPSWVGPASGEADFSSGQDDFSMWWEGDELPDLVNTASDSGAGVLASAVAASVQLSGAQFASSTTPMQARDTFPNVAECLPAAAAWISDGVTPVGCSSSAEAEPMTNFRSTADSSTMTDRPTRPGFLAVADAVASLAIAGPTMGIMGLAFRAANVLGVDQNDDDAMSRIVAAAAAALQMERLLADSLLRTSAFAVIQDPSGLSSLAALTADLGARRCRRLESDSIITEEHQTPVQCARLAIEEPVIFVNDSSARRFVFG
jgi:hypothetical protein